MSTRSQRLIGVAFAGLVGVAGLVPAQHAPGLLPTAQAAGEGPGIPERDPTLQNVRIFGRLYGATTLISVWVGGAPIDPPLPPRMTVSVNLSTFDGGAVGTLPTRFVTVVRSGRQFRLLTLERINEAGGDGDGGHGLPTATYVGVTRAFNPGPGIVEPNPTANVTIQWREGRRPRALQWFGVAINTMLLP